MKSGILVETANVKAANYEINRLLTRNREERRGLAMIYGLTGVGKTAYVERTCFSRGWLYYRIKMEDTAKSFLRSLYDRLSRKYLQDNAGGRLSAAQLEGAVISLLCDNPDTVIVIDEINLLTQFRRWHLAELIRDLVDSSFATFVLVGEETTYAKLKAYNNHYFDRSGFNYEFAANNKDDYKLFLASVAEVKLAPAIATYLHKKTGGNLRKAVKELEELEALAKSRGLSEISTAEQLTGLVETK